MDIQQQNQALLEAVNRAASGDLDLDALQISIEAATTSFEVRGYHGQLSVVACKQDRLDLQTEGF